MVSAFKANENNEDAESHGDESEENLDICEKAHQEAFVGWKCSCCFVHTQQLVVKVFETAPAYSRTVKNASVIVK